MEQIIKKLSNEEYHRGEGYRDYLSSTQLKAYAKSPKYAYYMMKNPQESTPAMRQGTLFHDCMEYLSTVKSDLHLVAAEAWSKTVAIFDAPINPKTGAPYGTSTKAYTEAYDAFLAEHAGQTIASADEVEAIKKMVTGMLYNCGKTGRQVCELIEWGEPEVSHFVEYEGIKFKFRCDLKTKKKMVDWKTTSSEDLTEDGINRLIQQFGYAISAAFYQFFNHEITGEWLSFYLVIVSKDAPYDAVMVCMDEWCYRYDDELGKLFVGPGAVQFEQLRDMHIDCIKKGMWPGAETLITSDDHGYNILTPIPPMYFQNKYQPQIR